MNEQYCQQYIKQYCRQYCWFSIIAGNISSNIASNIDAGPICLSADTSKANLIWRQKILQNDDDYETTLTEGDRPSKGLGKTNKLRARIFCAIQRLQYTFNTAHSILHGALDDKSQNHVGFDFKSGTSWLLFLVRCLESGTRTDLKHALAQCWFHIAH